MICFAFMRNVHIKAFCAYVSFFAGDVFCGAHFLKPRLIVTELLDAIIAPFSNAGRKIVQWSTIERGRAFCSYSVSLLTKTNQQANFVSVS